MAKRHPLIFALQGPRGWWWPMLLIVGGLAAWLPLHELTGSFGWSFGTSASLFAVGYFWWFMRGAERAHYKRVKVDLAASGGRFYDCPVCTYNLQGTPIDEDTRIPLRCPECGEDLEALRRRLIRAKL